MYDCNPVVKHLIVHIDSLMPMKEVYVLGKGWYRWNKTFHVYNSDDDYGQLRHNDACSINYYAVRHAFEH